MKTFRQILAALLILVPALPALAQAPQGPAIRLVQIRSAIPLPESIPFEAKPMGYEPGFELFYIVKGEGLAGVKKDSIVLDHIRTRDGTDLAAHSNGRPAYEMGSFPKASEDGRWATFSVKVSQNAFGKVESLAVKGRVVLLVATRNETLKGELTTAGGPPVQMGPFSAVVASGPPTGMRSGFFAGSGDFGVQVTGPCDSITEIALMTDGGKTKSNGNMTMNNGPVSYFFPKPAGDTFALQIRYWADLQEQTVSFGR